MFREATKQHMVVMVLDSGKLAPVEARPRPGSPLKAVSE